MRKLIWYLTPLIGWIFAHMSFAIPVKRLRETETLLAFYHPKPAYQFHVLIVPKKSVASLKELDSKDSAFLPLVSLIRKLFELFCEAKFKFQVHIIMRHSVIDLYSTVQSLVDEFQLSAYRLIVNGGAYQDFPQLHFHLISEERATQNT